MIYTGVDTGKLDSDPGFKFDVNEFDELTRAVIQDVPEVYDLPTEIQDIIMRVVQKSLILGSEDWRNASELSDYDENDIVSDTLEELGVSAQSPYVTHHHVRSAATLAVAKTIDVMNNFEY